MTGGIASHVAESLRSTAWTIAPVGDEQHLSVPCTPRVFAVCWTSCLFIHVVCVFFHAFNALVYVLIDATALASVFAQVGITVDVQQFVIPTIVHASIGAVHATAFSVMIVQSIKQRVLTFGNGSILSSSTKTTPSCIVRCKRQLGRLFGRRGLLGVESRHYELTKVVRQIIHTALQTHEAHQLSRWVPNDRLNRFYVFIVVVHCLTVPAAVVVLASKPAYERLLNLTLDIVLSFVSLVVVGGIVAFPYSRLSSVAFQLALEADPMWIVRGINELKLLLISTWSVMLVRLTFSVALLISLNIVKSLLVRTPGASVIPTHRAATSKRRNDDTSKLTLPWCWQLSVVGMHAAIAVWGIIILAIHLSSESIDAQRHCALQVRPWLLQHSACALYVVDCDQLGTDGSTDHTSAILAAIDPNYLQGLTFRGCGHLEMPSLIQTFPELLGVKIFNSTLVRWDHDADIAVVTHPKFVYFIASHVNLTSVPLGLRTSQGLSTLTSVQFSRSNLTQLPNDLDQVWPKGLILTLEHSHFDHVPDVVFRLELSRLSMVDNDVRELPAALFQEPRMVGLWLNFNPIAELPLEVDHVTTALRRLRMTSTNLTVLPPWMNDAFFSRIWVVQADDTPFCRRVANGSASLNVSNLMAAVSKIQCRPAVASELDYYPRSVDFG